MPTPTHEDDLETIGGHVDLVRDYVDSDEWPDDAPVDEGDGFADVLAAWAYVNGYANSRGMTATELIKALGLDAYWEQRRAEEDADRECVVDERGNVKRDPK